MNIFRMRELSKILGISRANIYQMIGKGEFPKGVKLSERARGWTAEEIEAWIETRREKDEVMA